MIIYGSYLKSLPGFVKSKMRKEGLSEKTMATYRKDQIQLDKRLQKQGDVFRFIEGNGRDFKFGLDIKECAKVKFLKEQDAVEFMPYVCLIDIIIAEAIGTGMTRTQTIADRFEVCNFRLNEKVIVDIDSPVYKKEWDKYSGIWE